MRSRDGKVIHRPTNHPVVFGAPYSVYVRAVRLALEEKAVQYQLVPVDIFATQGPPPEYMARQPFGKIPAYQLYEAGAITRYVDDVFPVLGSNRIIRLAAPG